MAELQAVERKSTKCSNLASILIDGAYLILFCLILFSELILVDLFFSLIAVENLSAFSTSTLQFLSDFGHVLKAVYKLSTSTLCRDKT